MTKRICFYHSADLDGHCSGAILNHYFQGNIVMYGINYGDDFPFDLAREHDEVWMVDFSLNPFQEMIELNNMVDVFIWIDHHLTAMEAHDNVEPIFIRGTRTVGKAGCELTWEFLTGSSVNIPTAVSLLGRYDVWDHQDNVIEFQEGMRLNPDTRPENAMHLWTKLLKGDNLVNQIIYDGSISLKKSRVDNAKFMSACSFATEADGLKIIAANVPMSNSQRFESVWNPDLYDAMCPFYRTSKGKWTVSLFTDKPGVDVSEVAKAHGGGGHVQAAGFACEDLPSWLK